MDYVFGLIAIVDDFIASGYLERLFSCFFGVLGEVPLGGKGEAGVELFDACEFVDFGDHFFVFLLELFDGLGVGA